MAGGLYDHLLAVVLVGALFAAAVGALPNVGYVSLLSVDQQQLRNVALSALNTMLLDSGYPINWGSGVGFNPASVVRFGLASSNDSQMYVLDMDKVMHLVEKDEFGRPNPMGYLPPDTVRQLLGLQNYGFTLKILAPFNVTVRDLVPQGDLTQINYEATVKFNNGKPIPNAVVNALIFYSIKTGGGRQTEKYSLGNIKQANTTNALGKCTIVKSLSGEISDVLTILEVTVGDIHTVTSVYRRGSPPDDIAIINIVGDDIILTTPPAKPRDNRWILSIDAYTDDAIVHLYNGTQDDRINWGEFTQWLKNFPGLKYMNPVILIINFRAVEKQEGRRSILVIGTYPNYLGSRVLSYGTSEGQPKGTAGVSLQRVVSIAGMTYYVEFTLWKQ